VTDEKGSKETRVVLRFHPRMAPVKAGILPLLKNKPELVAKARALATELRKHCTVFYDEAGAIGRRYRRQDEIGTPLCITVDFETPNDDSVTVRDRDTTEQVRIPIGRLDEVLAERLGF